MTFKPVDTAIVMVVGPCIDDTDFKSLEEAIAYNAAGMDVSLIVEKTDGTTSVTAITLTTAGTSDWTHKDGGYYEVEVTAVQNAEEGIAYIRGICTGVLPFESPRYSIVKANIYDSLIKGTDTLQTDVTQLAGVAQSLTDLKDLADTGYNPVDHKVQGVVLADTVTALTGHTAQTGDSFARLGAPAGASIAADLVVIDNFVDELESRLSAIRAGYLDNLSAGAVALDSGVDITKIHGAALTETIDGYLAAAFTKLFDVATPLLVASDAMRGTEDAALAATALTDVTWTDAKAAFIDHSIATVDGNVDAVLLDTGTDGVVVANASKTGYALTATGADLILKDSTFALAIADAIWDEILTGATHNIATSAGRRVREIAGIAIHTGTAQAGTATTITLAAAANGGDGVYNRNILTIVAGTGNGQTRAIVDYNNTTKVCLMSREWRITPDVTSEYQILADDTPLTVDHGLAQAATATTITIRDYASAVDDTYLCNVIIILAGTGRGQARLVGAYNGTTKVITICGDNWATTPDTDSVYALIPYGAACVGCVNDDALAQVVAANIAGITDGSYDQQEMMRIMFAALSGKSSGGGTPTLKHRDSADAKDRITATVDGNGNRTSMTLDGS